MNNHELLEQSLKELQEQFERHQEFVRGVLGDHKPDETDCPWSNCRHRRALIELVMNTIGVLEDTRRAFKSKQLEALRKDLMRVLTEQLSSQ